MIIEDDRMRTTIPCIRILDIYVLMLVVINYTYYSNTTSKNKNVKYSNLRDRHSNGYSNVENKKSWSKENEWGLFVGDEWRLSQFVW